MCICIYIYRLWNITLMHDSEFTLNLPYASQCLSLWDKIVLIFGRMPSIQQYMVTLCRITIPVSMVTLQIIQ